MKPHAARALRSSSTLLGTALLTIAGFAGLRSAHAADASASATAEVLVPIAITKNTDLVFGKVVAGNGDVTLSTSGARTRTGAAVLPTGTTPSAARFDITGSGSNTFSIDTSASDATLSDGVSSTMAVDWITEVVTTTTPTGKTDETTDVTTGTLSAAASGVAYIYVGGKLSVGTSQAPGTYTGSIRVTVAYN